MNETAYIEIVERIKSIVMPYLNENNIELVDIAYRREQGGMVLRLLVDTASGVTVMECEGVNNYLSGELDTLNVIDDRYTLEVSSPGLDRPIVTDADFRRSLNKVLEITTYQAIDQKKTHEGRLLGMDGNNIVIESNGVSTVIEKKLIAMARLKIEL